MFTNPKVVEFRIRVDCRKLTVATPIMLRALVKSLFSRFRVDVLESRIAFIPNDECDIVTLKSQEEFLPTVTSKQVL